jgi:YqjK-like protein
VTEAPPPLALRRASLIALAQAQRLRLAADVEPWRRPLSIADRGIAAARFIGSHPVWTVGAAVAPVALRTAGLATWFRRGLMAWQIVRGLRDRGLRGAAH